MSVRREGIRKGLDMKSWSGAQSELVYPIKSEVVVWENQTVVTNIQNKHNL